MEFPEAPRCGRRSTKRRAGRRFLDALRSSSKLNWPCELHRRRRSTIENPCQYWAKLHLPENVCEDNTVQLMCDCFLLASRRLHRDDSFIRRTRDFIAACGTRSSRRFLLSKTLIFSSHFAGLAAIWSTCVELRSIA